MSANRNPIYGDSVYTNYGQVTTANAARDGTGAVVAIATGGANGSRIDLVQIMGVGTVTNGMIRLFLSLDGGTTKRLIAERPVSATTPSATVAGWADTWVFNTTEPLFLPDANAVLYGATEKTEIFNLIASGLKY